jgi:hypothetical protein
MCANVAENKAIGPQNAIRELEFRFPVGVRDLGVQLPHRIATRARVHLRRALGAGFVPAPEVGVEAEARAEGVIIIDKEEEDIRLRDMDEDHPRTDPRDLKDTLPTFPKEFWMLEDEMEHVSIVGDQDIIGEIATPFKVGRVAKEDTPMAKDAGPGKDLGMSHGQVLRQDSLLTPPPVLAAKRDFKEKEKGRVDPHR